MDVFVTSVVVLLFVITGLLALFSLYILTLSLAGMLIHRKKPPIAPPSRTSFAILIPAHNEERLLPHLLENLRSLDYPLHLKEVFVVADNCSDRTAEMGIHHGATVVERHDTRSIGKGYALQHLLKHVWASGKHHDAYVFLDADCEVSSNFLKEMDSYLQSGSSAVQGYYAVSNPNETPVSSLRFIAFVLKHYVRPKGRQTLGLSCGLFGTGMAFRADVLKSFSWDAFSLAEDVEYFLRLTQQGIRVDFAPEAVVSSRMPGSLQEAGSQNQRWEKGRLLMAWRYGPRFLVQGVLQRDLTKLDAALEQMLPPLSFLAVLGALLPILAFLTGNVWLLMATLATDAGMALSILLGLLSSRVPLRTYRALLFVPPFIVWKTLIYSSAFVTRNSAWVRTRRSD